MIILRNFSKLLRYDIYRKWNVFVFSTRNFAAKREICNNKNLSNSSFVVEALNIRLVIVKLLIDKIVAGP